MAFGWGGGVQGIQGTQGIHGIQDTQGSQGAQNIQDIQGAEYEHPHTLWVLQKVLRVSALTAHGSQDDRTHIPGILRGYAD